MEKDFLQQLGLEVHNAGTSTGSKATNSGDYIASYSPVDGALVGHVSQTTREEYEQVVTTAQAAFLAWRNIPAPRRGEIVRQYGDALRKYKDPLGH